MARDNDLIINLFNEFDEDQSGVISERELASTLAQLDPARWNADNIADLLTLADLNRDGVIDYTEFVAWLTGGERGSNVARLDEVRLTHAAVRATRLTGKQVAAVLEHYDPQVSLDRSAFVKLWRELELSTEAAAGPWFDAINVNSNGLLSFKELMTALVLCSGEEDMNKTAAMLMKIHSLDGVTLSRGEFNAAIGKSVDVMKATFYPAVKQLLITELTPEGVTWAEVFIANQRYDMGAAAPESDNETLDLALRLSVYPEGIFDTMLEGVSEQFNMVDSNHDSTISLEELRHGLATCEDLNRIMFPQHAVGAMVTSFVRCL